ncbi:TonB-dependent receptor [Rhodospirillaceae bacterium SYSU D60014]|uniref:TonB-dependent receptor n=1 Tax=Virgifigura deserti TaxID=2268457 RepID=UPI000E672540
MNQTLGKAVARRAAVLLATTSLVVLGSTGATHGQAEPTDDVLQLDPVVVSATRSIETTASIPGAVTVITRQDIEEQSQVTESLSEMLGQLVPGLATSSETNTIFGQTLRGRTVLVLIDGVPQNTNRDVSRDLTTINAAAVERIEVIRGATAIYGNGAAGGVINIITRKPDSDEPRFTTEFGGRTSLSNPDRDGLGGYIEQNIAGRQGRVDYLLNLSAETTGAFYDADGDRIPPELSQGDFSDTDEFNILGKTGFDVGDQRLEATVNYFDAEQNTDFVSDPSVNALPDGATKARALKGLALEDQPETRNLLLNLGYSHADVLGSRLHGQIYYRDYFTRFFPFDGRAFGIWNNIAQTRLESEAAGGRLNIETPVSMLDDEDLTVLWGVDYEHEVSEQPAAIFDPTAFDGSGGLIFEQTDDRTFVPPITHDSVGLFAQLEWALGGRWVLRTGLRHERIRAEVDDFVTLGQGNAIEGGSVDYSDTVYNAGAVFYATEAIDLYANFSQGFSLPDLGLGLRGAPTGFSIADSLLEPVKVDEYEVGVRGTWTAIQASLAGFYNESDLGVSSAGFTTTMVRAPERVYGVEATLDAQLSDQWQVGGTFTWTEGESDPDLDDDFTPLNGFRIPPVKVTSYVEYDPRPWWRNRLQLLYSGERDRAAEAGVGFGGQPVDDFAVVDLISAFDVGPGTLRLGVENLFNTQYHTPFSQLLRSGNNSSRLAAQGTVLSASYRFTW